MVTKHVFPAAYPRSDPQSVFTLGNQVEPKLKFNVTNLTAADLKQKRKDDIKDGISIIQSLDLKLLVPPQNEKDADERAKVLSQTGQPQLWGFVERISSLRERPIGKPITLIMAHATGFHKEIFRPSIQSLIESFESEDHYIDEIWSLDNFRAGDAGILNAPYVGPAISSHDIARDIQQFIQFYLLVRSVSLEEDAFAHYSLHLNRQECGQAKESRTIIAIGHSQGAATLFMAVNAVAKPNQPKTQLVDGIISFDGAFPLRKSLLLQPLPSNEYNVVPTLVRKDVFNDQKDIMDYLNKIPMFKSFDDRVKNLYAKHGFKKIKIPDQENQRSEKTFFVLKMSKWSEALSFCQLWLNCWTSAEIQRGNYKGWTHFMVTTFIRDFPDPLITELYNFCEKVAETNAPLITFEYVPKGHLYPLENPEGFGECDK